MTDAADIAIVGGSVAGAATATFLARRGYRVVVLEADRFPRDKPCGEGLMPHGVDVLAELGALDRVRPYARPLDGVRYALADGTTVAAGFPELPGRSHLAFGIRRFELDRALLDCARDAGDVCVRESFRVRQLIWEDGAVAGVSDGTHVVRARVVVGADGLRSRVRRVLGWDAGRRGPRRYAVTGHVRLAAGADIGSEIRVLLYPGMEAYITPLGGADALVALLGGRGFMRRFAGDLEGAYRSTVRSLGRIAGDLAEAEFLRDVRATGPFGARTRRVCGRGVLLVGDAAGFLDPITGEGMATALLQARAAADVIDPVLQEGGRHPDLGAYAAEHRRIVATSERFTWIVLGLCAFPRLTVRATAGLQKRSDLLGKLLAVNFGYTGLNSISPREWLALLTGW